ncbi:MAG: nicotinate phosphoribosyltransferase [Clostridia bacterium]|nr:nicotinate phosphoribosyltransferase [Clostridia bacterium]
MKLEPIVVSLLDTDLYKFNMDQVIFHKHTDLCGEYHFKCRNEDIRFTKEMLEEINAQIDHLCSLSFTKRELDYLRSIRFIKNDYVEFLRLWHPIREYVFTSLSEDGELSVIVDGPLFSAMQFEIYLLEIINEVYFRLSYNYEELQASAMERLDQKIADFNSGKYTFSFAEFGCRRRLSREWQDEVVRRLATETKNCVGTSNVYLAMKYDLTPIGTYAHEFVQMYQGIDSIPLAFTNHYALRDWYDEYDGDNGTALTDTITTDLFLLDFNRSMVNNYSGVRHDSGDPFVWGDKIIDHYKKYGVDPKTKLLLFSDSLNFDNAQALYEYFKDKTKVSFGIGTFCSNDTCVDPLNIVIKLQYVNDRPVAKLSDTPGKAMCDDESYLHYLKNSVQFRLDREPNEQRHIKAKYEKRKYEKRM